MGTGAASGIIDEDGGGLDSIGRVVDCEVDTDDANGADEGACDVNNPGGGGTDTSVGIGVDARGVKVAPVAAVTAAWNDCGRTAPLPPPPMLFGFLLIV